MIVKQLICLLSVYSCLAAANAQEAGVPDLKDSPFVKRLWLGIEQGVIRPASYEQVVVDAEQRVAIHADDGANIKKGQHWATLDPLNLELERRSHAIDKIKGEQDMARELATLEEERIKRLIALKEAETNLKLLEINAGDQSLPASLRKQASKTADELTDEIELMKKSLEPESMEQQREVIRNAAALQQDRRDKQLEDLEKRSMIVADNDGVLTLGSAVLKAIADADGKGPYWIKASEVIGAVNNDEHFELWVDASGPLLGNMPLERLKVNVRDANTGAIIPAKFDRIEEVDQGIEIKRRYVFMVDPRTPDQPDMTVGVRSMVDVFVIFEKAHRRVFKKDIAHLNPELLESGGWAGLVSHLWPGSKVVHIGPQTIAVQAADEN